MKNQALVQAHFQDSVVTGKATAHHLSQVLHAHHLTWSSRQPIIQMCETALRRGSDQPKPLCNGVEVGFELRALRPQARPPALVLYRLPGAGGLMVEEF